MAFVFENHDRLSASAKPGLPQSESYFSLTDDVAAMSVDGYFNDLRDIWEIGSTVTVKGTDTTTIFRIVTLSPDVTVLNLYPETISDVLSVNGLTGLVVLRPQNIEVIQFISSQVPLATDATYLAVTQVGGVTLTLLTSMVGQDGYRMSIKDELGNAALNNITIATEGSQVIDNANTHVINADLGSVQLIASGGNWFIL